MIGALFISFALALFKLGGLLTGSTAGLAFLIFYTTGLPFGAVFFVINLPFYVLAFLRMGWRFTVKTFIAVALTSVLTELHAHFIRMADTNPFYVAVFGGLLMGVGFIVLFRHKASLGGVNILALYVQDHYGIRAGKLQLAVDLAVLAASFFIVSPLALLASIIGVSALNMVIWMNHRHDRYIAWSAP